MIGDPVLFCGYTYVLVSLYRYYTHVIEFEHLKQTRYNKHLPLLGSQQHDDRLKILGRQRK